MSRPDILRRICRRREERIAAEGPTLGVALPSRRRVPLVPFPASPAVICEIKRRSPSRGAISAEADPVATALAYQAAGVGSVSVLTEEDHFGGSLADLMAVKDAAPRLAVLRKDFLQTPEDLEVAYRAGADAVLLIAAMLDDARLAELFETARGFGLAALVEVHNLEELDRAARLQPPLLGINSRDLVTFGVDRLGPLALRSRIDWPCSVIFESGIHGYEDALFAASRGFSGVLVGEAAMRNPRLAPQLLAGLARGLSAPAGETDFWLRLLRRRTAARPLVKICGITNRADALAAVRAGADILGFVYAESPRRAPPQLPAELADIDALKVAVVVCGGDNPALPPEVTLLLQQGHIDALQFHGDETSGQCSRLAGAVEAPYYKALRLRDAGDAAAIESYHSPRVLVDAFDPGAYGGTGRQLAPELVARAAQKLPLWLAGGIGCDNVAQIIERWRPELIDASSRLESRPGRKDHARLAQFFAQIARAAVQSANSAAGRENRHATGV